MKKGVLKYRPISCSFYDLLLSKATLKEEVEIVFKNKDLVKEIYKGIVKTIETKNKAEYLILETGNTIRLDYIVSLNNVELSLDDNCSL